MHRGVSNHSLVLKRVCSLCHHHAFDSESYRQLQNLASVSSQKIYVAFCCHCISHCLCFVSCNRCHDPFIVRFAQTCPSFTGFIQLAHPSRCSRSTLTTACSSVVVTGLCVHIRAAVPSPDPSEDGHLGVWDTWSVEYRSCKLAMLL